MSQTKPKQARGSKFIRDAEHVLSYLDYPALGRSRDERLNSLSQQLVGNISHVYLAHGHNLAPTARFA